MNFARFPKRKKLFADGSCKKASIEFRFVQAAKPQTRTPTHTHTRVLSYCAHKLVLQQNGGQLYDGAHSHKEGRARRRR